MRVSGDCHRFHGYVLLCGAKFDRTVQRTRTAPRRWVRSSGRLLALLLPLILFALCSRPAVAATPQGGSVTVTVTASPTSACLGETIHISASYTTSNCSGGSATYLFSADNSAIGSPTSSNTATYVFYSLGIHHVGCGVTVAGCGGGYGSTTVTVGSGSLGNLTAFATPSPGDTCTATNFFASATAPCSSSPITYLWSFGDSSPTATGATPTHQYTNPGTFTVVVTASGGGATATTTFTEQIIAATPGISCTATATPNPCSVCDFVQFSAPTKDTCVSGTPSITWDLGDGTHAIGSNVAHQYPAVGSYTATATATLAPYTAYATVSVTVVAPQLPNTPTNLRVAPSNNSIVLTWDAMAYATSYTVYRSTDGVNYTPIATTSNNSYTDTSVTTGSTYSYEVSASNCAGSSSKSAPVSGMACTETVTITSLNVPTLLLVGEVATFTVTAVDSCGRTLSYGWTYGDGGGAANVTTTTHAYSMPGNYFGSITVVGQYEGAVAEQTFPVTVVAGAPMSDIPGINPPEPAHCLGCGSSSSSAHITKSSGNLYIGVQDPVATRGYPLACIISLNSQAVELNRPMGNASFSYDIHVTQATVYSSLGVGSTHWLVVDGDGFRLDFGPATGAPAAIPGIFSTLTQTQGGGYTLSGAGPPGGFIYSPGNFTYTFNPAGQLTQLADDSGNLQTLNYTGAILTGVTDQNTGKTIAFTYTGALITQIAENGGTVVRNLSYTGNLLSRIVTQTAGGQVATTHSFIYNSAGILASEIQDDDQASAMNFTYKPFPCIDGTSIVWLANESDALGSTTIQWGGTPDAGATATVKETNPYGGVTLYDFDAQANLIKVTPPLIAGQTQATIVTYQYNANRQATQVSDGTATTQIAYGANGMPVSVTDPLNNLWQWTWNGTDLATSQDPVEHTLGVMDSLTYNDPSQPHVATSSTDASGVTWNFAHNVYGQITGVTPPAGSPLAPSSIMYDEQQGSATLGYPLQATDGNGNIATFDAYDPLGDLLQASSYPIHGDTTTKNSTIAQYDAAQRVTQVVLPDSHTTQNVYAGRFLDHTIDPGGTQVSYSYCPSCGALTGISGPLNWNLSWALDGAHQVRNFTDANSHGTTYSFGLAGEPTGLTYPDGSVLAYLYNNFGGLAQVTNGRGSRITMSYDGAERPSGVQFPTSGAPSQSFAYNADSSLQSYTDATGTTSVTYLPNGEVASVVYNYATSGLALPQELDYSYYPDGLTESLTWKSNGVQIAGWNYFYDAGGRLTSVSNSFNENTSWQYDGEDKLVSQTNSNGTGVAYNYNQQRGWPTSFNWTAGGVPFAQYNLTYDNGSNTVGNLTGVNELDGSTVAYQYDALYRLTGETRTGTNAENQVYGYDVAGNRTTAAGGSWGFDVGNKPTSGPNSYVTFSSDGDGNLTNASNYNNQYFGSSNFTWDDSSQLTMQGQGFMYGYDAGGTRVWSQAPGQPQIIYIYDGDTLIGQISNVPGAPAYTAYTWGAAGLVAERLIGINQSFWYAFGPQGETRQLTNATGTVVDTYCYTAYGVPLSAGPDSNIFQFGGQVGYQTEVHSPGGTILCGARWYDPALGRWLSRDPIGYDGGADLYVYCGDNPVGGVDPDGTAIVQVRFLSEGGFWYYRPYHAYILVTDKDGTRYIIRGGPTNNYNGYGSVCSAPSGSSSEHTRRTVSKGSLRSAGGSSNSSNGTSPGAGRGGRGKNNGPFGPLRCWYGMYNMNAPDYQTTGTISMTIVSDNQPASYWTNLLDSEADKIDAAYIPYNPLTTNSNAVARSICERAGIRVPNPVVWAPGWSTDLPTK